MSCKTKKEFAAMRSAYSVACKNKWLKDYTWLEAEREPNGYWHSYENCYNAAKQCKTKKEFRKRFSAANNNAAKNGWLSDYIWFEKLREKKGTYTREKCREIAVGCHTRMEFHDKCSRAYQVALKKGWMDDYTWFEEKQKPNGYWDNYDKCFKAAKECNTRSEFLEKYYQAYICANKNGWINDYTWFETKANYMTDRVDNVYAYVWEEQKLAYVGRSVDVYKRDKEHRGIHVTHGKRDTVFVYCEKHKLTIPNYQVLKTDITLEEGLYWEDWYCSYFRQKGYALLNKAKTGKGSGSIGGIGRDKYSYKRCYDAASKCKTNIEFCQAFNGEWQKAYKKGWIKDYIWFKEIKKPNGYWKDYDNCYNAAKECATSKEFRLKYPNAYAYSRKMRWHLDYTWMTGVRAIRGTRNKANVKEKD